MSEGFVLTAEGALVDASDPAVVLHPDSPALKWASAIYDAGVSPASVHSFEVPGAFDLPVAARWCAESGRFAGVACLGAVIRGETDHYDYVCETAAHGIQRAQLDTGVPCTFGVLTVENMDQALARSGGGKRDQGCNAARATVQMARLVAELRAGR